MLELVVNHRIYSGWQRIKVTRSMDQFAHTFSLTLTDTQTHGARTIKPNAPCEVRLDGTVLITGFIDQATPSYDGQQRSLSVSGRSKTADLVDCTLPPSKQPVQKEKQTLLQLAQSCCKPFGISVTADVALKPVATATLDPGETIYEFLERYARAAGVLLLTTPAGNVHITRASSNRAPTALVLGDNLRAGNGSFDRRDVFSDYFVLSQRDQQQQRQKVTAHAKDSHVSRYRATVVSPAVSLDNDEATRYAEVQRNVAFGRSQQAVYTVSGWQHAQGLWQCNRLVRIQDAWLGLLDVWWMLATVEFTQDKNGRSSRLTLMPKEAYDMMPLPLDKGVTL